MSIEIPLTGAGGEPVDFWRTLQSHGVAELPPAFIDPESRSLTITVRLGRGRPQTLVVSDSGNGQLRVSSSRPLSPAQRQAAVRVVRHLLRLDQNLTPFYSQVTADPDLAWAASGAGRMTRCATVFEEVVKTICTTNCTWSATVRMVSALVQYLGEPAAGAPDDSPMGRAFPTPLAMASASEDFYQDVMRAGYRGPFLREIAARVARGDLGLERLGTASEQELSDDEIRAELLALPGVGPYAAAHIMTMLGRFSRLIFDSWTRPKYWSLTETEGATDAEIEARFAGFGRFAGLAFWLFLTRDWVEEPGLAS
jgi:3-methyladenine DNA glycosylase/8-oxoguanine DNA glycosylase